MVCFSLSLPAAFDPSIPVPREPKFPTPSHSGQGGGWGGEVMGCAQNPGPPRMAEAGASLAEAYHWSPLWTEQALRSFCFVIKK